MYTHSVIPFGKFEKHLFHNKATNNSFSLVPKHGACILDIVFNGQSVIDGYQTPQEVEINRWAKNALLFPFPNRLKDGTYQWKGRTYYFPINDHQTQTALHGFGMSKPLEVTHISFEEDQASVTCTYQYGGALPYYPFPFTFSVTFRMKEPFQFEGELSVQNNGSETIPFGMGWHPYFNLAEGVEEMSLHLPICEMVGIDAHMIPTGQRYTYDKYQNLQKIGSDVVDNCFSLTPEEGKYNLEIEGSKGRLKYWQETGKGKFNFIQLFTPPHRQSFAIEPMTCNVDAFNNGEGLLELAPGEKQTTQFGIQYEQV